MLELKGLSYQVEDGGAATEILKGIDLTATGGTETTLAKPIRGINPPPGDTVLWNGASRASP